MKKANSKDDNNSLPNKLRFWNLLVASIHSTSFFSLLLISIFNYENSRTVFLWTDFGDVGSYKLLFTLLPFPFITAIFHILAAFDFDDYYSRTLNLGVNRLRWIEYGITNGLMSWSLAVLAGAGNIILPILAVLFNVLMQKFGCIHESINHPKHRTQKNHSMWPLVYGFLPWIANWFVVLLYFFSQDKLVRRTADWFAILGSLVWSLLFIAPLIWRYYQPPLPINNYYMELAYIMLSLSAKLWLDWIVTLDTLF